MKNSLGKIISVVLAILLLASITYFVVSRNSAESESRSELFGNVLDGQIIELEVKDKTIFAEVAASPTARAKGLMLRKEPLVEDNAMLFTFEEEQNLTFWMKNTYIPLDIVFLDKNLSVINIHTNTTPNQTNQTYSSDRKSKYVLEFNAFWTQENKLEVGDTIKIVK